MERFQGVIVVTGTENSHRTWQEACFWMLCTAGGWLGEPCLLLMMPTNSQHRRPWRGGHTDCCIMAHASVAHQVCLQCQDKIKLATPNSLSVPFLSQGSSAAGATTCCRLGFRLSPPLSLLPPTTSGLQSPGGQRP